MSASADNVTRRSRWLDWKAKTPISAELAGNEPSKPTKLGFDGFVGAMSAECPEIAADGGLARLAPVTEFVSLKGGLVVPVPALRLALDLEARGFRMRVDEHQQFVIEPTSTLTEADLAAIGRWRLHLGAITARARASVTHQRVRNPPRLYK